MDKDTRVRVRFITKDDSIRTNEAPLAVPTQLTRHGLSEVINHLLSTSTKGGEEGGRYDFLIDNQLLRCSLDKFLMATGLSTEATVTIEYFRSLDTPSEGPKSTPHESWISAIAGCGPGRLIAGSYDGSLRCYTAEECKEVGSYPSAHDGPIKALVATYLPATAGSKNTAATEEEGDGWLATGGKDRVIKTWQVKKRKGGGKGKEVGWMQREVWTGHENSVECMALREDEGEKKVLSGDWRGMVILWKSNNISSIQQEQEEYSSTTTDLPQQAKKKRKGKSGAEVFVPIEKTPTTMFKAHAQCVSGIAWDPTNSGRVFTSSWDHSIKLWDLERQDQIQTFNGSKVVTCLSVTSYLNSNLVASGHPDGRLRIWDVRVDSSEAVGELSQGNSKVNKKVLAGCGSWISGARWHPCRPSLLASISHDGQLRLWDIRASKPLSTLSAQEGKGLALCFDDEGGRVYTGGEDGVVRSFSM